jgi:signal transduction histidine kinase/CheY-like chemotaxis protein
MIKSMLNNKKSKQLSLKWVLIVPFVLQIIGAVGLVGYFSYRSGEEAVNKLTTQLRNEVTQRVVQYFDNYLAIPILVNRVNTEALRLGYLNFHDLHQVEKHIASQLQTFNQISDIQVGTEQGELRVVTRTPELSFLISDPIKPTKITRYRADIMGSRREFMSSFEQSKVQERPWYQAAVNAGQLVQVPIFPLGSNLDFSINMSIPIYATKNHKLLGVMGVASDLSFFRKFLLSLQIGKTGRLFIIERNGLLIGTSINQPTFLKINQNGKIKLERIHVTNFNDLLIQATSRHLLNTFKAFSAIETNQQIDFIKDNTRNFVEVVPYRNDFGLDWLIVTVIPASDFMAEINANTRMTLLFCLLTLITTIILSIITSNLITKPIRRLSQASEAIAEGELNQTVEVSGIAELKTLSSSFNIMANQLHESFETLENRVQERTAELEIAKDKAEVANKAKSSFIANMSHELRSPLNAIIGFSQVMLRTKNLPQEQYENAGIIHRSGEYLLTLINNVLDFSKIEAGKTTLNLNDIDLYQLLDDLEDMLHLRANNAGIELIFNRGELLPHYIHADGVKLRQVLLNLLGNAIKFTSEGEVVLTVNTLATENTDKVILNFSIRDTGVGIAEDELNNLFQAFSQTHSGRDAQEGTGLGLVISRQFVQLMGGDISVTSNTGEGTTFSFSIAVPLGHEVEKASFAKTRVLYLAPNQPIYKILIVDDKAVNRQLMCKLLVPLGFEMQEASNGQEAIAIWEQWQPHLIWMDMRMPVMDGYEATKFIKSHVKGNATAVIALTASVLEEEKAIVLSAGCDDFLRKPFKEVTIFDALTKHLGVQFIYDDANTDVLSTLQPVLNTQHFQIMPQEWLIKLSEAALEADTEQVMRLIQDIPETETLLANGLTKLVRQFQFEQILDCVSQLIRDNS